MEVGMELEDLKHRVLQGNRDAFKEWMDVYIQSIERFSISYGVTLKEAGRVAETVFRNLYHSLEDLTEDQLEEKALYKSVLNELERLQIDHSVEDLFPFEEDNELHRYIVNLSPELRVPLILFNFHHKSISEIAAILDQSEEQVENSLKEAQTLLDEPNLEKKLGFLNKSYHRLPPSYDEKHIYILEIPEQISSPPVQESKTKVNKRKPLLLWGTGVVLLIGLLFISVIRSEAYQYSTSEKFIEELKTSFEQEIDNRFSLLGIEKPAEDTVYHALDLFGDEPRRAFARQIGNLNEHLEKAGKIDKKAAMQDYQALLDDSRLPSEMIEDLRNNPLTEDREKSHEFLNELNNKVGQLSGSYIEIIYNNYEEILSAELNEDGVVDRDLFLEKFADYPIELQNAIKGMETQSFYLDGIKDVVPIYPQFGTPEALEILEQNLHPDVNVYIYLLSGESMRVMYAGTMEEKLDALFYIEKEVPNTTVKDDLHALLSTRYSWSVYNILGIYQYTYEYPGIYDENKAVREEIREKWRQFASIDNESISVQVMKKVIDELEENNWKSRDYDIEAHISIQLLEKVEEIQEGNE